MRRNLKSFLPKSLYGRAALILIMPVILVQVLVSLAFIQRHFDGVTRQLSDGVANEILLLLHSIDREALPEPARAEAARLAGPLQLRLDWAAPPQTEDLRRFWDVTGRGISATLKGRLPAVRSVDLVSAEWSALIHLDTRHGPLVVGVDRGRLSAINPHQLLVIMGVGGIVLTLIAIVFLRNQLVPITRLARAAEAFGKGQILPYRLRGATEVRAAGKAFLDMRARIERQMEQRTMLLSGVSHDLRTPLTRMKLGLSLMEENPETLALQEDVAAMERLVEEFLSFARGDATEATLSCDPAEIARQAAAEAARSGIDLRLTLPTDAAMAPLVLRPEAVLRALHNLIQNAHRFAGTITLSVAQTPGAVLFRVEDDGPGIPEALREKALQPFERLDAARNPNRGGGVGLGLAIAADIARNHGGELRLSSSTTLGGLCAELQLAR